MSKAQGDGFRTWTDREFNAYKDRLWEHLRPMRDKVTKWYDNGDGFWVLAESWNELYNPNGVYKWHGWKVEKRMFRLAVYEEEVLDLSGDTPEVNGLSLYSNVFDNRDEAIMAFFQLRA